MKTLKKFLADTLAVFLIFSSVSVFSALAADKELVPVIVVPGYSASDLFLNYGEENEKHVWGLSADTILKAVEKKLGKIGKSLLKLGAGDIDTLVNTAGEVLEEAAGVLAFNEDGTSKYNVTAGLVDPATTNTAYLVEKYGEKNGYIQLPRINDQFCDEVGAENVFNCHCDFRLNAVDCALVLDKYVQAVKEYTGAKKVKLFGLSHGGMTVGVFLSLVANHPDMVETTLDDIDRATLFHPALGGAYFLCDAFDKSIKIDAAYIVNYAEIGSLSEYEFEVILHLFDIGILDTIANKLVDKLMDTVMGYWGSIWDFAPADLYEGYKAERLDPEKSAPLIAKSDFMHNEIMPNYANAFKKAQDAGVKINIIAGYGKQIITGAQMNSDSILATNSTSGALCAPLGKRFADGYTQSGSVCTNPSHNHVSPTMEIDASYGYLPENTFFVYQQFHGQAWFDPYTMDLCMKTMFTDEIQDIYSSPDFTQFEYSRNAKDEVLINFDGSGSTGFMAQDCSTVYVKNMSAKYPIVIKSIYCKGSNLKFDIGKSRTIKPGKTLAVKFSVQIPDVNMVRDTLVVNYTQVGAASFIGLREIPFTYVGGQTVVFDETQPYTDFENVDPSAAITTNTLLGKITDKLGLTKLLLAFVNTLKLIFANIRAAFAC